MLPASRLLALTLLLSACSAPARPAPSVPPVTATTPSATPSLLFSAQPGWISEPPSSAMRKAQYRLPHSPSDTEDASLVVYWFGGSGGSAQANIERWITQFEQPDGRPSGELLHSSSRELNGMHTTEVELSGTYVAETAPGSGEHVRKEDWRMLAAIVEAKEGPYYVKLVGPRATLAQWEASYREFLSGLKPGS